MTRARDLSKLTNSQAFSVDNNFNVGINSTVPAATLDIRGNTVVTGVLTATSFSGTVNASGLTGTPDITVNNIVAAAATFSGVVTYEDVTNVDSVGIITARSGVRVTGGNIQAGDQSTGFSGTVISGFSTTTSGNAGTIQAKNFGSGGANFVGFDAAGNDTARILTDGGALFASDVSIADKIVHTGDTNTAIRFPAADTFTVETGGSERARVDSSGRLLLNTNSARTNYFNSTSYGPLLNLEGTGNSNRVLSFIHNDGSGAPLLVLGATGGSSAGSNTIIGSSGKFGFLSFQGADGSQLVEGAKITGEVDGTPGADDMPGRLTFHTTADGAASPTERLRITSTARFGFNTAIPPRDYCFHSGQADTNIQITNNTTGVDDSAGALIQQDGNDLYIWNKENSFMSLGTNAGEKLRIDSSGRLLIGATTSTSAGSIQAKTQIVSADFNAALAIRRNQNSDGAGALIFFKNRGTSNSSNTVVQDDDDLGNIRFFGNDGTDFAEGAAISARVDGTPGSNDMPAALQFKTSADGAEAPVTKFTIDSTGDCTVNDGDLVIGTNGHGIDFSADGNAGGMTSELLDDYEEGTFTPTANNFTVSGTSTLTGQYVKIGRQVTVGIKFANTGTIAHATSAFIGGLPFSMASGTEANGLIGMLDNANSTAFNSNKSGTQCKLDGEGGSRFFPGSFSTTSSGGQLLFGGTYISAS